MPDAILSRSMLFHGMSEEEINAALRRLNAAERRYRKGETVLHAGEPTSRMGMVLSGAVTVESCDPWGKRTLLSRLGPGQLFAESYALLENEPLQVDVCVSEDCRILFLDLTGLQCAEPWAVKMTRSLLSISARKNLALSLRSFHTAPKTVRERVTAYLNTEALRRDSWEFDIPFDRQQLADYLNLDRTALSKELGSMRKDGLIDFRKNHFKLLHRKIITVVLILAVMLSTFTACGRSAQWERNSGLHGSADVCWDNAVICTVFVNGPEDRWNFTDPEDCSRRDHIRTYLGIACEYLEREASRYGRELAFVWDFEAGSDLAYTYDTDLRYETEGWDEALWRYLDENVDSTALSERYRARNIIYLTCMNTDETCEAVTSTRTWYPDMPYPYEFISLYYIDSGVVNCPAVYAHEILHTFGAPDLYMEDPEYGIGEDFVSWVALNLPNDIMYHCSDMETGEYVYDRITNEVGEVTAYYIGWLTDSEIVNEASLRRVLPSLVVKGVFPVEKYLRDRHDLIPLLLEETQNIRQRLGRVLAGVVKQHD